MLATSEYPRNMQMRSVFHRIVVLGFALVAIGAAPAPFQAAIAQRTAAIPGSGIIAAHITPEGTTIAVSGTSGTARPLDEHSLFQVGSVTKTFTATLLATMVLDGEVKLDDPIAKYLPPGVHAPTRDGRAITLLDLAEQRSGLPRMPANMSVATMTGPQPYETYDTQAMFAFLSGYTLPRDPGAQFEYSNYGAGLLGQLLANRAHMTYAALLRKRVLAPLGMNDTTLAVTATQASRFTVGRDANGDAVPAWRFAALAPAGAIISSIADLTKYARCNMGAGPLAKACLFAQAPRAPIPGNRIGLIWWTDDATKIIHHGGDTVNYHAGIAIAPDRKSAAIVLENGGIGAEDLTFNLLVPTRPIAKAREERLLDNAVLGPYVGTYVNETAKLTYAVTARDGRLLMQLTAQGVERVFPTSPDEFAYHDVDARVKFVRDATNAPVAVVLTQDGNTLVFLGPGATMPPSISLAMFPPVVALDDATLQSYVGTYGHPTLGTFVVTRDGDQLSARLAAQPAVPIFASAKDVFYYQIVTASIDFARDASGRITSLTLHQNGQDYTAKRLGG